MLAQEISSDFSGEVAGIMSQGDQMLYRVSVYSNTIKIANIFKRVFHGDAFSAKDNQSSTLSIHAVSTIGMLGAQQ